MYSKSIKLSLLLDWIFVIILGIVLVLIKNIKPNEKLFSIDDISISYPHKEETIKMNLLVLICVGGSFIIITGCQYFKGRMNYDYHQAIMGSIISCIVGALIGNTLKTFAGRYRPDFLSICQVDFAKVEEQYNLFNISSNISYGPRNLYDTSICTAPYETVHKQMKSLPSGHTNTAFSFMSYLALYIAGQIHLFDGKSYLWKYVVVIAPYFFSFFVALSRVFDNRHHWEDVIVGSLIGLIAGTFTYFYYFPSLKDENCDTPYQTRKITEKISIDNQNDHHTNITANTNNEMMRCY